MRLDSNHVGIASANKLLFSWITRNYYWEYFNCVIPNFVFKDAITCSLIILLWRFSRFHCGKNAFDAFYGALKFVAWLRLVWRRNAIFVYHFKFKKSLPFFLEKLNFLHSEWFRLDTYALSLMFSELPFNRFRDISRRMCGCCRFYFNTWVKYSVTCFLFVWFLYDVQIPVDGWSKGD